jgi:hypothetical protein
VKKERKKKLTKKNKKEKEKERKSDQSNHLKRTELSGKSADPSKMKKQKK